MKPSLVERDTSAAACLPLASQTHCLYLFALAAGAATVGGVDSASLTIEQIAPMKQIPCVRDELPEKVKKTLKLHWTQRESVCADLWRKVRRLLAKYGLFRRRARCGARRGR
jgi:hypothetical protein